MIIIIICSENAKILVLPRKNIKNWRLILRDHLQWSGFTEQHKGCEITLSQVSCLRSGGQWFVCVSGCGSMLWLILCRYQKRDLELHCSCGEIQRYKRVGVKDNQVTEAGQ